jgi:ATP-binding cassette, subfamily B, bacterial
MKLLLQYLKPYKWLIVLAIVLAAINQVFSLFDPLLIGKVIDKFANHPHSYDAKGIEGRDETGYINGVLLYLGLLVGTAMVSRIAKAFQDYFVNVIIQKFGAKIFTDGLRHSMRLPYQEFEDQRSGETLSI